MKSRWNRKLLESYRFGLERESLRIDAKGNLAKTSHPKTLGSPLTHPYISTDFGEQQLEWNTPPFKTLKGAHNFLKQLMQFTLDKNPQELFWPLSMPPHLETIQIAQYGTSHAGRKKVIYREGLKDRYGMDLQMISGIHYNLSFDLSFWKKMHRDEKSKLSLQDFINDRYLGLIRNFLREGWLLTYLFGASPASSQQALPYATSIRTSSKGYYSRVQNQLAISFNSLEEYLEDLHYAVTTPKEEYGSIPSQLNDHILQIENEHYSRIRPKLNEKKEVSYVEVRSIDLDPFSPVGITIEQMDFLHLFLLYCVLKKSPPLTKGCQVCLTCNQDRVALEGRKKGLLLHDQKEISLEKWGLKILKGMEPIAKTLGKTHLLQLQKQKVQDPSLTLSARIALEPHKTLGLALAKSHKKNLQSSPLTTPKREKLEAITQKSLLENTRLETASEILVNGYEDLELSTQVLLRKALDWNIQIEVLDRKDQFLCLQQGGHTEYVKEATKTSKDPYIAYHLLENKQVTKNLLKREGLSVPEGESYTSIEEAEEALPKYLKKKCVIKPKEANFGLGVFIIDKGDQKGAHHALRQGFSYGSSVLIETFCPGKEYRFLIIDGKCIGIANRIPANVTGDGTSTIAQLVHAKNHDPHYYRDPKTHLHLGPEEKKALKKLRLSPSSILKKGRTLFLRHNSNVSTGGDAIDVTDHVHPHYAEIATRATKTLGAHICGVDMLLPHPTKPSNYSIIELNYNPVLFIHAYPYKGTRRDVATPLLHLLGFTPKRM